MTDTGAFWGEVPTEPAEPIAFQAARKDLLSALSRTQHAIGDDEDRPVLQSWWLTVDGDLLSIHTADNYRLARATIDVSSDTVGRCGIHRSEGRALLAFLASGPSDVSVDVSNGAWSITTDEGMLTGRLSPGTPPDWLAVTKPVEPSLTFSMNGRYAQDAAKAAVGASGMVTVDWESPERPVVYRSDGFTEWIMPIRIGGATP